MVRCLTVHLKINCIMKLQDKVVYIGTDRVLMSDEELMPHLGHIGTVVGTEHRVEFTVPEYRVEFKTVDGRTKHTAIMEEFDLVTEQEAVNRFNNRLATYSEYIKCLDLNGKDKIGDYPQWAACYFERFVEVLGDEETTHVIGRVIDLFRHFIAVHGITNIIETTMDVESDIQWANALEQEHADFWLCRLEQPELHELTVEWSIFVGLIKSTLRTRKYEVNSYIL